MMRITTLSSLTLAAGLTVALLTAAQSTSNTSPTPSNPAAQSDEVETMEGRVVDLHGYVTSAEESEDDETSARDRSARSTGGPVGLLVREEGLLRTTETVHVIAFDPESEHGRSTYDQAKKMTGQNVKITGRPLEREGLRVLAVQEVEAMRPGEGETPQRPGRQDRPDQPGQRR